MYLCVDQVQYGPALALDKKRRRNAAARCLRSHRAGCSCWKRAISKGRA